MACFCPCNDDYDRKKKCSFSSNYEQDLTPEGRSQLCYTTLPAGYPPTPRFLLFSNAGCGDHMEAAAHYSREFPPENCDWMDSLYNWRPRNGIFTTPAQPYNPCHPHRSILQSIVDSVVASTTVPVCCRGRYATPATTPLPEVICSLTVSDAFGVSTCEHVPATLLLGSGRRCTSSLLLRNISFLADSDYLFLDVEKLKKTPIIFYFDDLASLTDLFTSPSSLRGWDLASVCRYMYITEAVTIKCSSVLCVYTLPVGSVNVEF